MKKQSARIGRGNSACRVSRIAMLPVAASLGFAVLAGTPAPARAQQFSFRIADDANPGETMADTAQWFADEVTRRSNGRVTIKHFPSSTLGTGSSLVQAARNGSVDIAVEGVSFYSQLSPALGALMLPFEYSSDKQTLAVANSAGGDKLLGSLEPKGVKGLTLISNGWISLLTTKPIHSADELKGLRLRALPSQTDVATLKAMGASPVSLESAQIYLALRQGTVEGVEATLHLFYTNKLYEVAKNVLETRQAWLPVVMGMNLATFNRLPPDLQKLVQDVAREAGHRSWDESTKEEDEYADKLKAAGITIIQPTPEMLASFKSGLQAVYPGFVQNIGAENVAAAKPPQ